MVEPAVRGTQYVVNAAAEAGTVRRVGVASPISGVYPSSPTLAHASLLHVSWMGLYGVSIDPGI